MPPAMLRNGQSLSAISGMPPIDSPDHPTPLYHHYTAALCPDHLNQVHSTEVAVDNWAPIGVQDRWRYATPSSDQ